ncbi:MAG TPA: DUF427 domain-containing protein [Polyangiales bacterium]|nr:DUF427 domain-containing protein [Polyangiales bacterium]
MGNERLQRAKAMWHWVGDIRPPFAVAPGPGQESVWDYPRPPRVAADAREVIIKVGSTVVARTRSALRVLETASPPTFYLPVSDIDMRVIEPAGGSSHCEWKGAARYFDVRTAHEVLSAVAWSYAEPYPEYAALRDHLSFYPGQIECTVDGARVKAQPGGFYGGWITPEVVGPFKGDPGSGGW